jgi:nitrite reductase/ring-hydroxylating ferredoxin subunit
MKHWWFILPWCLLLGACEDVNKKSSVPHVPVNYTLYITSEHPHFVLGNGYQTITVTSSKYERESVGYAGLLIWVSMDNHYHAADLCCPNCLKRNQPVAVDGQFAVCPTCNEHFDLSYGYAMPTKGYTKEPLRKYQALLDATGHKLHITN